MQDLLDQLGGATNAKNGKPRQPAAGTTTTTRSSSNTSSSHHHLHDKKNMNNGEDNDNCGWCDEFDRGPCHVPFRLWMQCCDTHPETYPTVCKRTFQNFNKCLEKNATWIEWKIEWTRQALASHHYVSCGASESWANGCYGVVIFSDWYTSKQIPIWFVTRATLPSFFPKGFLFVRFFILLSK